MKTSSCKLKIVHHLLEQVYGDCPWFSHDHNSGRICPRGHLHPVEHLRPRVCSSTSGLHCKLFDQKWTQQGYDTNDLKYQHYLCIIHAHPLACDESHSFDL